MSVSFVCENIECPAPLAKKGKEYLMAMECPFCDVPLTQQTSFSVLEERLINSLPYLIAYPLRRALLEQHAWTKVTLFKDTFLNYLKYLGLLSASEFFASDIKNKNMVSLFQNALAEPSFGTWNTYIRETLKFLKENDHRFFIPELVDYYERVESGKKVKLYTGNIEVQNLQGETQIKKQEATGIGMLINFRNRYLGHGLTLDDRESRALWEKYSPIFFSLLEQLQFATKYVMYKNEHGITVKLHTAELFEVEHSNPLAAQVWIENLGGDKLDIVPFFIVPGELSIKKEEKEQLLTYESYTGKTIKFFSPEGTEKQSSGRTLERLNLLLRDKQSENTYSPEAFTKEVFAERIREENKLLMGTLIAERKILPGIYVHREEMEIRLREWIGARMGILFIAAEAGSGKTNLLIEVQRQYQERGFQSLIIRAGRMERATLAEQLIYMFNLEKGRTLSDYPSLFGTQDAPTFLLIDGLNEAVNAESIWTEIIAIAKLFAAGSIKFVVTNRSNSTVDLERYFVAASDEQLLYREGSKEGADLKSAAYWLTALNMEEMKLAWGLYSTKDKSRFKPLFSFDVIASLDRGIYDQISNPLILRIFLEVYNGKHISSKGKKVINIWEDWLLTFSSDERAFMNLLAERIWVAGVNELLLDDLLQEDELKEYLLSDALNSPYQRLKNLGWISRYTKDLNIMVGFTVERLLLHLLGKKLESVPNIGIDFIGRLIQDGSELQIYGIEQFLSFCAIKGDLSLIKELIDIQGVGALDCTQALTTYIRTHTVESLIGVLLEFPTDGDWLALIQLDKFLEDLTLEDYRNQLAEHSIKRNSFLTNSELKFALNSLMLLSENDARKYFDNVKSIVIHEALDYELLYLLGNCYERFGEFVRAQEIYEHAINILSSNGNVKHDNVIEFKLALGMNYDRQGKYKMALDTYNSSLVYQIKNLPSNNRKLEIINRLIGAGNHRLSEYDNALEYYYRSLNIGLLLYGQMHPNIAKNYANIGLTYHYKKDDKSALKYFQRAMEIFLNCYKKNHIILAPIYQFMGLACQQLEDFKESISYYQRSLDIQILKFGESHPNVAMLYSNIADLYIRLKDFNEAVRWQMSSLRLLENIHSESHPDISKCTFSIGFLHYKLVNPNESVKFLLRSLNLHLKYESDKLQEIGAIYVLIAKVYRLLKDNERSLEVLKVCRNFLKVHEPNFSMLNFELDILSGDNLFEKRFFSDALGFYLAASNFKNSGLLSNKIAECYLELNDYHESASFYLMSAEMYKDHYDELHVETQNSIKKLNIVLSGTVNSIILPEWIRNVGKAD